ncbi:hypothetical protein GOP47_0005495 [Adiantum capillus-veneris]|uniref:Uncharacterized protein n=1 Tax=Adiantum capillus-veneris TaxID=13818 RepID=A0A9D4V649_ADICA|nr:hypothetical protein GOP47_0005495 [Adiantum capillus-veneris]
MQSKQAARDGPRPWKERVERVAITGGHRYNEQEDGLEVPRGGAVYKISRLLQKTKNGGHQGLGRVFGRPSSMHMVASCMGGLCEFKGMEVVQAIKEQRL